MTNENPRGLPVAWVDAADLSERECFEVLACSDKYKGVTQHELRYNTPLVLATDYAALLAERDGLVEEVAGLRQERDGYYEAGKHEAERANGAEQLAERLAEALRTAREYIAAELECQRDKFKGYEHCSDIDSVTADLAAIDAAISAMEGGAS